MPNDFLSLRPSFWQMVDMPEEIRDPSAPIEIWSMSNQQPPACEDCRKLEFSRDVKAFTTRPVAKQGGSDAGRAKEIPKVRMCILAVVPPVLPIASLAGSGVCPGVAY